MTRDGDGVAGAKPMSVWRGTFTLFGVEVHCHVLSDGRRIVEADSVAALFDAMENSTEPVDPDALARFAAWQMGKPGATR